MLFVAVMSISSWQTGVGVPYYVPHARPPPPHCVRSAGVQDSVAGQTLPNPTNEESLIVFLYCNIQYITADERAICAFSIQRYSV